MKTAAASATLALLIAILIGEQGCAVHRAAVPFANPVNPARDWVDFQPGWRIRVVTPLLTFGGFLPYLTEIPKTDHDLATDPAKGKPLEITLSAGKEFVGYEVAFYSVQPRGSQAGRVRIVFDSAEANRAGSITRVERPTKALFQLPKHIGYVRLLHVLRVSDSDHQAAILGAADSASLDRVTTSVISDPGSCEVTRKMYCSWIPKGIAVIPERPETIAGKSAWVSAR